MASAVVDRPRKLRLIAIDTFPSTAFRKCGPLLNACSTPGADIDLLKMILQIAGFEYELLEVRFETNALFFEMLRNGSADMSALAVRVTPERMEFVLFTTPIDYLQYGYSTYDMNYI
jgi:hypothetical protein